MYRIRNWNGKGQPPVYRLTVTQCTGRGKGTESLTEEIPMTKIMAEIAATPELRMQMLAALLAEEEKRALQPA